MGMRREGLSRQNSPFAGAVSRRDCIALAAWALGVASFGVLAATPKAAGAAPNRPKTLLVVGDSLSAEYGLKRGSGWVALMEQRLAADKLNTQVVNASISGDTTSGGRSRLPALLAQHKPSHVIIELGGNDALRGLPLKSTAENLTQMLNAAQAAGARTLLVGIQVPPNYGRSYSEEFAQTFVAVAKATKSGLVPFFLKGVADGPQAASLFQADRIHPNEQAQPLMLDTVWPQVKALLTK